MTKICKLESMPYAQAHVEIHDGNVFLFSYNTLAASLTFDGWVSVYCLCSQTTRRHVGAFLREYAALDYATGKQLYSDNMRYNICTGEIEPED